MVHSEHKRTPTQGRSVILLSERPFLLEPTLISNIEEAFLFQLKALRLPIPIREYVFAPPRKWRFDFVWIEKYLAVEIEGGTWSGGRHTRGQGFTEDCRKYNHGIVNGWRVLRFTGDMVKSGEAITTTEQALKRPR